MITCAIQKISVQWIQVRYSSKYHLCLVEMARENLFVSPYLITTFTADLYYICCANNVGLRKKRRARFIVIVLLHYIAIIQNNKL